MRFRPGMWCVDGKGRLGIFSRTRFGMLEFHYVDDGGGTKLIVPIPDGIRQARISEIPAARLAHTSRNVLQQLGYED
jgi:hypothetical protein